MSRNSAAIGLAALLLAGVVGAAEPVLLQYKFQKGEPLRYRLQMKSKSTFSMPDGKKESQDMASSMELTQELIEAKADGSYRVSVSVEKATQTVNGQEKPFPTQPGPQLMTMLPSGKVLDAQGPDPGTAGQMQMVFPTKAVNEGEGWEQVGRLTNPLPLETVTKYTLDKAAAPAPGGGTAALVKSDMTIASEKSPGGEQVNAGTKGTLYFDVAGGRILKSDAKAKFSFTMPVQVPGMPQAQNVNVNLEMDISIELVKGSAGSEKPSGGN
ncbi:MAG: hypothetical protein HYY25_07565 [Candidatus Wallbacteria bacterium]|nr:hypothetical protein [Candidatus Wallbacteria bacterium]MBI4866269.1 hypothetical protein [Candidatus Wallbacteria bacterium]